MKIKYLSLFLLTVSLHTFADNVNPLNAKVVKYKDTKINNKADYTVSLVQTNVPELNKELEKAFCHYAYVWDAENKQREICLKKEIHQAIEDNIKEYSSDIGDGAKYIEQNYVYLNNNQYFKICTHLANYGTFGNQSFKDCSLYDISNPKKPVLTNKLPIDFLNDKQKEKIKIYFSKYGNWGIKKQISSKCNNILGEEGINYKLKKEKNEEKIKWSDNIIKHCQSEIDKELLTQLEPNAVGIDEINDIKISKQKDKRGEYYDILISYYGFYGKLCHDSVEIYDEKILEELIPKNLWNMFMEK